MCCVPQKERSNLQRGCTEKRYWLPQGWLQAEVKQKISQGSRPPLWLFGHALTLPFPCVRHKTQFGGALASVAQDRDDEVGLITVDGQEVAEAVPTFVVFSGADCSDLASLAFQSPSVRK